MDYLALKRSLPSEARLLAPESLVAKTLWEEATRSGPGVFQKVYPDAQSLEEALRRAQFGIELRGGVFYFTPSFSPFALRVHGIFLGNPFRALGILRACLEGLFLSSSLERLECLILHQESPGLKRLLERLGFTREGQLRKAFLDGHYCFCDGFLYSILREEVLAWANQK